jgi:hypothetical protein
VYITEPWDNLFRCVPFFIYSEGGKSWPSISHDGQRTWRFETVTSQKRWNVDVLRYYSI